MMKPTAHPCSAPTNSSTPLPSAGKGSAIRASKATEPTFRSGSTAVPPPSGWSAPTRDRRNRRDCRQIDVGGRQPPGLRLRTRICHRRRRGRAQHLLAQPLAGTTELVSTDESGDALSDPGLAELDLSSDGSRVLVGEEASKEGNNVYYQLYLHMAASPNSVKLAPDPVLFDGMIADGSRVFFTTTDNLAGDTDESADIFEVEIASDGSASAPRLCHHRRRQPSNNDSCAPPVPRYLELGLRRREVQRGRVRGRRRGGRGQRDLLLLQSRAARRWRRFGQPAQPVRGHARRQPSLRRHGRLERRKTHRTAPEPTGGSRGPDRSTRSEAAGVAVDQSNGDIYVNQSGNGKVTRFTKTVPRTTSPRDPARERTKFRTPPLDRKPDRGRQLGQPLPATSTSLRIRAKSSVRLQVGNRSAPSPASARLAVSPSSSRPALSTSATTTRGRSGDSCRKGPPAPRSTTPTTKNRIHTTGISPCNVAVDSAGHAYAVKCEHRAGERVRHVPVHRSRAGQLGNRRRQRR